MPIDVCDDASTTVDSCIGKFQDQPVGWFHTFTAPSLQLNPHYDANVLEVLEHMVTVAANREYAEAQEANVNTKAQHFKLSRTEDNSSSMSQGEAGKRLGVSTAFALGKGN
eukprot:6243604-Amphidinium_carterae.1